MLARAARTSTRRCLPLFRASFFATNSRGKKAETKTEDRINYNDKISFSDIPDAEHVKYKRVTANDLEREHEPPRRVKMLVRDFIEDSLYNPNYGYFSKQATIFTALEPIDFSAIRNSTQFEAEVSKRYASYGEDGEGPGKQLWHTPTELFKPWYGRAIAQSLVSEYLLKFFPYEDFVIYEIGAGNGTLALDILDYLQEYYPDVYERTRYNIIEISANLASLQREKLSAAHSCVTVHNRSIFRWDTREPAPCYFLAMEVIDNFAHDLIRYDLRTLEPYQGIVTVDKAGDFSTYYTKITDPLISDFLALRRYLNHPPPISRLLKLSQTFRTFYTNLPFAPNLSPPEYIPTRLLTLLRTLRRNFPRHRLLLSDFSSLPDTIPGVNAPVVQTRFQNAMVPCETLLVRQGYFDIFFPTNFENLRDMYEHVLAQPRPFESEEAPRLTPISMTASPLAEGNSFFSSYHPKTRRSPVDGVPSSSGLPVGERKSQVYTHADFMATYADLSRTQLRNGENPLLDTYKNVKFLF
ncbi:S-adenosyl-L-methionine-dependent methyltransferase [Cerioporus squamosus]|nr:S-adenosyl-L-methionine-dependent methyltransferase [Cerioporus squamosus]